MKKDLNAQALEAWSELAYLNCRTDLEVNNLLEAICLLRGTAYHGDDIVLTISNLTNSAKRRFIKAAAKIDRGGK